MSCQRGKHIKIRLCKLLWHTVTFVWKIWQQTAVMKLGGAWNGALSWVSCHPITLFSCGSRKKLMNVQKQRKLYGGFVWIRTKG